MDYYSDVSQYFRPKFSDTSINNPRLDSSDYIAELKQDGMWTVTVFKGGVGEVYSAPGMLRREIITSHKELNAVLVGEYLFGSNWSIRHNEVGKLVLFDILVAGETDLRAMPLEHRLYVLGLVYSQYLSAVGNITLSDYWSAGDRYILWDIFVEQQDFEGLVYKSLQDNYNSCTWYRTKKQYTIEYVCMGMNEGAGRNSGRMGSLVGGLHINGALRAVCFVGGGYSDEQRVEFWFHREQYVGKVFTARGWSLFDTGALRHPNFCMWRDDKSSADCVMPVESICKDV